MPNAAIQENSIKLHLGCGKKILSGFVNIDILPSDGVDEICSVTDLSHYTDNSVDLIYACHILEHFGRHEYKNVLKEWFRVLRPGGILRLSVPSFEACVKRYQHTHDISEILGLICGGQKDEYDFHKIIFDTKFLSNTLTQEIGFKAISTWDWQTTEHSETDDFSQAYLPHMDKENGMLMSINIEAQK